MAVTITDGKRSQTATENKVFGKGTMTALTVNGNSEQEHRSVPVYSVDGKCLRYNQQVTDGNFVSENKWFNTGKYTFNISNNKATLTLTQDVSGDDSNVWIAGVFSSSMIGHKVIALATINVTTMSTAGSDFYFYYQGASNASKNIFHPITEEKTKKNCSAIFTVEDNTSWRSSLYLSFRYGKEGMVIEYSNVMAVDLTDMFGAGNEPETVEAFYATPQGKLYYNYVEYGYHVLGGCEYKTNQIFNIETAYNIYDGTSTISFVKQDNRIIAKSNTSVGYRQANKELLAGHCYYVYLKGFGKIDDTAMKFMNTNFNTESISNKIVYFNSGVITKQKTTSFIQIWYYSTDESTVKQLDLETTIVDLTAIYGEGNEPTTIAQIQATRPDLLVNTEYKALGTTEYGVIFNDGYVYKLDAPLYGVNTIKDNIKTNGVLTSKMQKVDLGTVNFNNADDYNSDPNYEYCRWVCITGFPIIQKESTINIVSDFFIQKNSIYQANIDQGNYISTSTYGIYAYIMFKKSAVSSSWNTLSNEAKKAALKTYLTGKYAYYEVATPSVSQKTALELSNDLQVLNETYTKSTITTPTPQYPETVKSVDSKVVFRGKNLFNFDISINPYADIAHGKVEYVGDGYVIVKGDSGCTGVGGNYDFGWYRPGNFTNINSRVSVKSGQKLMVSADLTLLEYNNQGGQTLAAVHLYGEPKNYTLNGQVYFNKTDVGVKKRVYSQVCNATESGYVYPVITLSSNKYRIENIQIEIVDTETEPTTYEQYFNTSITIPYELRKIGNYQDKIIVKNGRVVYRKEIEHKTFTGSEGWLYSTFESINYFSLGITPKAVDAKPSMMNCYNQAERYYVANMKNKTHFIVQNSALFLRDDDILSLTDFKEKIKDNYINYPLATSTETDITTTEFGKSLLALSISTAKTFIEITGSTNGTSVVSFYTQEYTTSGEATVITEGDKTVAVFQDITDQYGEVGTLEYIQRRVDYDETTIYTKNDELFTTSDGSYISH